VTLWCLARPNWRVYR